MGKAGSTYFHERALVAPLKPDDRSHPKIPNPHFKHRALLAALKPDERSDPKIPNPHLHELALVAPLKLRLLLSAPVGGWVFPRARARGPIEAKRSSSALL